MDFESLFNKGTCLLNNWEDNYSKILKFISIDENIKDKISRSIVKDLKSGNIDESKFQLYKL